MEAGHRPPVPGMPQAPEPIGDFALPAAVILMLIKLWGRPRFPFDRLKQTYAFADIATTWADTTPDRVVKPVCSCPEKARDRVGHSSP